MFWKKKSPGSPVKAIMAETEQVYGVANDCPPGLLRCPVGGEDARAEFLAEEKRLRLKNLSDDENPKVKKVGEWYVRRVDPRSLPHGINPDHRELIFGIRHKIWVGEKILFREDLAPYEAIVDMKREHLRREFEKVDPLRRGPASIYPGGPRKVKTEKRPYMNPIHMANLRPVPYPTTPGLATLMRTLANSFMEEAQKIRDQNKKAPVAFPAREEWVRMHVLRSCAHQILNALETGAYRGEPGNADD